MPEDAAGTQQQTDSTQPQQPARFPHWVSPPASTSMIGEERLRQLVLDYLSHSTCIDAATAFVREWDSRAAPSTSTSTSASAIATASNDDNDDDDAMPATATASAFHDEDGHTPFELDVDDVDDDTAYSSAAAAPVASPSWDSPRLSRKAIRSIRVRREIKRLIQQGAIQLAVDLCNLHFPSVLNSTASAAAATPIPIATKHAHPQFRNGHGAATPPRSAYPSNQRLAHKPSSMSLASTSSTAGPSSYISPQSPTIAFPTQPLLLALSLQIQLFIEIIRSNASGAPAAAAGHSLSRPSTPFGGSSSAASPSSNGELGTASGNMESSVASLASSAGSAMSGVSSVNGGSATSALSQALAHAQALHVQANKIQDLGMRQLYLRELESVSGLLPYHDPRKSPVAYYLDESRRDALAEAVNGAILLSQGESSTISRLESVLKQNELVWQSLAELKVNFPPEKGSSKSAAVWPIQSFDMQDFLSRPSYP